MIVAILAVDRRHLTIRAGERLLGRFKTMTGYRRIIDQLVSQNGLDSEDEIILYRSSSMDFPEESTSNPKLIKLARELS